MRKFQNGLLMFIATTLLISQQAYTQDVGVTAVTSVTDYCNRTTDISVTVNWKTFDNSAASLPITFNFSLNGVTKTGGGESYPAAIGSSAGSFTFSTLIDDADLVNGQNILTASATTATDGNSSNDAATFTFNNWVPSVGGSVAGNATYCAGSGAGTVTLSGHTGTILEWQSSIDNAASWSSIPSATTTTFNYSNLNTTTLYRAKIQSGGGAGGSCPVAFSAFATITINPIPNTPIPSSNTPVCDGQTIELDATNEPGGTYSWSGPNLFNSTIRNPTIPNATPTEAGNYTVNVSVNGCTSANASTAVNVKTTPSALNPSSNSPVCEGDTIRLLSDFVAGLNYTWSGPDNFASITQNPKRGNSQIAHAGTYTVFGTLDGCVGPSASITVAIDPKPATPTATSNSSVCSGDSIELFANGDPGVTWSWTGPNSFSSTSQNPVRQNVTSLDGGTYYATAILGACSSNSNFTIVNVKTTPNAPTATSNSPVCEGTSIDLNASTISGASYTWLADNGFTATGQNQTIPNATSANAGIYGVVATKNGCTSDTAFVTVTISTIPAAPSITTNSPACTGKSINLNTPTVVGATYSWSGPNNYNVTVQNPTRANATFGMAGNYSLFITSGGCNSPTTTEYVQVNQTPNPPGTNANGPLCEGETLNLTSSLVSAATYSWTGPNSFSSPQQNPSKSSVIMADSGNYCLIVDVNGCSSTPSCVVVEIDPNPAAPILSANSPVCTGDTLYLAAVTVTGASYSWTGPAGFTSSVQNPIIPNVSTANAGDYKCRVVLGNCASAWSTITVAITPRPTSPTPGSNSPICDGEDINLSSSTHTGASYSWSGPSAFSSPLQNPVITAASTSESGFYYVKITINGCVSDSVAENVVVNSVPSAPTASSNTPVCEGETVQLNTPNVMGAVYNWTGPNAFATSLQNPTIPNVTPTASGSYNIVVTVNGCTSQPGLTNVTVNPKPMKPTATNTSPICEGQDFTLMVNPVAGATYQWTGPGFYSSPLQNPTINSAYSDKAGAYFIRLVQNGCVGPADTTIVEITVVPKPIAGSNSPICEGTTLNLSASEINGGSYTWTGPNAFASPQQNPSRTNTVLADAGTYGVFATINSCIGELSEVVVKINPLTIGGQVVADTTVCAGFNKGPLSLINHVGNVLRWEYSSNNTNNWVVMSNTTSSNSFQDLTVTTNFRALVQSPGCPQQFSGIATISVDKVAEAGFIEPDSPDQNYAVCEDANNGMLLLSEYQGSVQYWETSIDEGVTWDSLDHPFDTYGFTDVKQETFWRAIVTGCSSVDTSEIYVLKVNADACEDIVIANLVTPNNDGKNDTWLIEDVDDYAPMDVYIYNRFGKELFHSTAYKNDWDASYQGQALQDGTYYYILTIQGDSKIYKGAVNVLR
jgi:gliding motility-associated-like protein